jgi:ribosomal protein L7/L12
MTKFETTVEIPFHIIEEIGMSIHTKFVHQLEASSSWMFTGDDIAHINEVLKTTVILHARATEKSREGWSLTKIEVDNIFHEILNDKKIMAIKSFRHATRAGLKDAKNFIDKFEMNKIGAMKFLNVFA